MAGLQASHTPTGVEVAPEGDGVHTLSCVWECCFISPVSHPAVWSWPGQWMQSGVLLILCTHLHQKWNQMLFDVFTSHLCLFSYALSVCFLCPLFCRIFGVSYRFALFFAYKGDLSFGVYCKSFPQATIIFWYFCILKVFIYIPVCSHTVLWVVSGV